ncbi:pentatricopeptide repeat-containing protein At5g50280, chloroplastic [Amaranthus tricolor]|uniref:pentatricopeptide repeat-containing protein At5g50280, chloroplastic n=1 Tax=Amaranthus tricolor TaxID=29722 RepID=UPI002585BB3E|nr:pentatricopeptide repeat-containing protein At5g50280, chloroplastic [Amaranthus tricolor]
MSLMSQTLPSFTFLITTQNSPLPLNPPFFFNFTKRFKLLSLCSSPESSSFSSVSSPSIFLPFLEKEEQEQEEWKEVEQSLEQEQNDDPIYRFFKSRTSTLDPPRESKLSLQRNRRTAWHLADHIEDNETEIEVEVRKEEIKGKDELGIGESGKIEGIVGEIVRIARNLPENSTLGEQLMWYGGRIGEGECVEVLIFMIQEGLMMNCLYFYEWMGLQEPALVTPRACSVLFPALGKAKMGDKLMVLWRNLPNIREFRDVHVYNAAMSGLLSSGRYQDAWKVYEAMEMNNILPDRVTGSTMITVMRKEGKSAKDAWDFFERMNRKGVKWSVEVVGALIKSFCEEGLQKQALIIQGEMEKKGISSNIVIYNTLMDAYCKSNQLEEAEALFVEMKTKGLSPTSTTYNIFIDAYSKRMQPDIVEKLLQEMEDIGLAPNVISYTSLISAYGRQKKMSDMAADAFLRMKKAGIQPTSHSYTALIHAYSISGWHEKAYKAFENMRREGIRPSIETYTALLDAFRRAGDAQTLKEIWKSMIREKIEGTRVTFNILLDGFAKQGYYVEARDVISEFGKIGFQPTVMTYNMLINAYARGGQHLKLPQLLKEMVVLNLKPDSITYSTMIYAFVRVRDFKRAFYYHKQMVKSGQVPDAESYQKLRAILDVKAAKKNKKDKSAILGIINSKMGLVKAKKKGKKDEFWKNKKKNIRFNNPDRVER